MVRNPQQTCLNCNKPIRRGAKKFCDNGGRCYEAWRTHWRTNKKDRDRILEHLVAIREILRRRHHSGPAPQILSSLIAACERHHWKPSRQQMARLRGVPR